MEEFISETEFTKNHIPENSTALLGQMVTTTYGEISARVSHYAILGHDQNLLLQHTFTFDMYIFFVNTLETCCIMQ